MPNTILIRGAGAVSPAGWGVEALLNALGSQAPGLSSITTTSREPRHPPLMHAAIPAPVTRPAWLAHPRLRRAGGVSHYVVSAALEALGLDSVPQGDPAMQRLGIILCVMTGNVTYSRRFYDEVLRQPSTASPVIFPETVFNAPASHLAALLGADGINYTLVGDASAFVEGLTIAASWITTGLVDRALVVGAEEPDWLTAEAWELFGSPALASGGAGAVLLAKDTQAGHVPLPIELSQISEIFSHHNLSSRARAIAAARADVAHPAPIHPDRALLVDGCVGARRYDTAETDVWLDWKGPRLSPKRALGEGFAAGSAWQCVTAVEALRRGCADEAWVSVPGLNLGAACVRIRKPDPVDTSPHSTKPPIPGF